MGDIYLLCETKIFLGFKVTKQFKKTYDFYNFTLTHTHLSFLIKYLRIRNYY